MIVVLADTHRDSGHGLVGRAATAVDAADQLIHAGDFTTSTVYTAFEDVTPTVVGVHGNRDSAALQDRLPATRARTVGGLTVAVTHRHDAGETGLVMLGRAHDAALVVSGHTHRPHLIDTGAVTLLNPGSHTDPRGTTPTHAELTETDGGLRVEIVTRRGTVRETGCIEG